MGFLAFLGVLVWRAWLQRRRHGTPGVVLFAGGAGQRLRDTLFVVLVVVLFGQAVAAAVSPQAFAALSGAVPRAVRPVARLMRHQVKQAGGTWNPSRKVRELRYAQVVALKLEARIVEEQASDTGCPG